jgi:hypothetical protein
LPLQCSLLIAEISVYDSMSTQQSATALCVQYIDHTQREQQTTKQCD